MDGEDHRVENFRVLPVKGAVQEDGFGLNSLGHRRAESIFYGRLLDDDWSSPSPCRVVQIDEANQRSRRPVLGGNLNAPFPSLDDEAYCILNFFLSQAT